MAHQRPPPPSWAATSSPSWPLSASPALCANGHRSVSPLRLALTYLTGTVLGLTLPAFYLLPAAIQRRNIQVAMAIIPNMRFQDNFLFDNTADAGHNEVNHTISLLAVIVLAATILAIAALILQRKRTQSTTNPGAPFMTQSHRGMSGLIVALTILIALLLFPHLHPRSGTTSPSSPSSQFPLAPPHHPERRPRPHLGADTAGCPTSRF